MFGIQHCVYYNCAMNGSNHLSESDRRVPNLCPICLRKLQEALKFDLTERYAAILNFCQGLVTRDAPLKEFEQFGVWILRMLEFLEKQRYDTSVKKKE